jgi:hypothetical protein
VREDHWIVVRVDDAGVRCDRLSDFVGVAGGRDTGADVKELADAGRACQVTNRVCQERALGANAPAKSGVGGECLLGCLSVDGEVVLAA